MSAKHQTFEFRSVLAPVIEQMIQEKRACGYKYAEAPRDLKNFDTFLCEQPLQTIELPQALVLQWLTKRPHEATSTHQRRIVLLRQLATMMTRLNYSAYIIPGRFGTPRCYRFSPYIFTQEKIRHFLQTADTIKPTPHSPLRDIVIPEIFHLLYGCGFRLNEVLKLRVRDVDLKQGVISVREAKFGKDRLVPPALDIVERLRIYTERLNEALVSKPKENDFFFPSYRQPAWSSSTMYTIFRQLLHQSGIHHGGRGKGSRIHDLRHTFAVHRLMKWHEEGVDLNAKLPLLVTYLGHNDFTGTQKYLHLTAELFPNLTSRMNNGFGDVIPGGTQS